MARKEEEKLTVCDIIGHFGLYQWSLTVFAAIYSSLPSLTVVVGPILTHDLAHLCASDHLPPGDQFAKKPHQCFVGNSTVRCTEFIYDDANYGAILTNTFDLVCDRQWLRSFISSSALTGMLISSVTLGLLSDKYGRKRMILVGFVISILATSAAILAGNYFLLNVCYLLMSFAQVGVANALCVLVMEATPPKLRFVGVFEYGIGWGLGQALVPLINDRTKNYQHFLAILLVVQLLMLPWLQWGIFESIRWLISEGDINRAQIELRRACRWNRRADGAQLAQKIAHVQVQQLRKASCIIETKLAPMRSAEQSQELSALNSTLRRSIALAAEPQQQTTEFIEGSHSRIAALSPTLVRKSVSVTSSPLDRENGQTTNGQQQQQRLREMLAQLNGYGGAQDRQSSLTTQALVQLALKHSNAIQRSEEGGSFLARMFHRKLYKMTVLLMLLSLMLETTYYSLVQANGFVGSDVNLNYYAGALIEWVGDFLFIVILWALSRRLALVLPTLSASCACLGIALAYHLIPDPQAGAQRYQLQPATASLSGGQMDQPGSLIVNDSLLFWISDADLSGGGGGNQALPVELRERINFWLMILGKLSITTTIQIAAVIAMEAYPNNLRQSGSGAIVFVGRVGSIVAPFLINDTSPERTTFKLTLATLAALGALISLFVPCFLPDNKDQELCDRLNEIPDSDDSVEEVA